MILGKIYEKQFTEKKGWMISKEEMITAYTICKCSLKQQDTLHQPLLKYNTPDNVKCWWES